MSEKAASVPDQDLEALVRSIELETGLCFPEVHHDTIIKAAREHCSQLGLAPGEYAGIFHTNSEEKARFLDDIMIGETYFFRDEKHFSALLHYVLPQVLRRSGPVRLWSVTCASGEEALSLMALAVHVKQSLGCASELQLLATDINRKALDFFRQGRFGMGSFRTDGRQWHPLLDTIGAFSGDQWLCRPEILASLDIRQLNILSGRLPEAAVDLIFFRNTLLYMKPEHKSRIVDRLVSVLKPGGFLFLASPEIPTVRHPGLKIMEREGTFFFVREDAGLAAAPRKAAVLKSAADTPLRRRPEKHNVEAGPAAAASAGLPAAASTRLKRHKNQIVSRNDIRAGLERAAVLLLAVDGSVAPAAAAGAETKSTAAVEVAAALVDIVQAIRENRFSRAEQLLDGFESFASENFVSVFLRGLLLKHQGRALEAMEQWEAARLYEGGFWPASFYLALEYHQRAPERAGELLQECRKMLIAGKGSEQYLALLDGFDMEYYRHMVDRMVEKLAL